MSTEFQDMLGELTPVLSQVHGESFTFASTTFKAWRVQSFTVVPGRLESAPDSTNTYEAVQATAPAFVNNSLLVTAGGNRRVNERHEADPTTGLFRFTLT